MVWCIGSMQDARKEVLQLSETAGFGGRLQDVSGRPQVRLRDMCSGVVEVPLRPSPFLGD